MGRTHFYLDTEDKKYSTLTCYQISYLYVVGSVVCSCEWGMRLTSQLPMHRRKEGRKEGHRRSFSVAVVGRFVRFGTVSDSASP